MKDAYEVRAVRWARGWELYVEDLGVTQSRSLAGAEQQVRDYLASWYDTDADHVKVVVHPEVDGLEAQAAEAGERTRAAAEESRAAAVHARNVVRRLRDAGVSVDDTATIMGVSKGRVSQLARSA